MALKFVDQIDLENKKIIARFDFNVPLSDGKINDTTRIDSALETIRYILDNGAKKLILMSHLGRPKGVADQKFSLEPVASYLAEQLGEEVILTESALDRGIKTLLDLSTTKIILLQNLRFHPEETSNDVDFAKALASYGEVYVNDAFGTAHRKHASTYEINRFFNKRAVGGFLLKKEIEALSTVSEKPATPFTAVIGGAKISDKIKIIEKLLVDVNHMLIGGAMAYPFLKARGFEIGKSLCSDEDVILAKKILSRKYAQKIILPSDHLVAKNPSESASQTSDQNIPEDLMALDIGPETISSFEHCLKGSKTILWNGPMGFFEKEAFSKGTFSIARVLAETNAYTLVGGGDSVSAVKKSGMADKMSHISTGGGASLEYLEQGSLPGIQALRFGVS